MPHPFLLFTIEPSANRLSPETALVATTGAPYRATPPLSYVTRQHHQHLTQFLIPCVLFLLFLCFCFWFYSFWWDISNTKVRNVVTWTPAYPDFSNDQSVVVLTYFYTTHPPTLPTLPPTRDYFKTNHKLLSPCWTVSALGFQTTRVSPFSFLLPTGLSCWAGPVHRPNLSPLASACTLYKSCS